MTTEGAARRGAGAPPLRRIVSFRQDDEAHWVAELDCGHTQHVRHDPPFVERPWVLTEQGRSSRVGAALPCLNCLRESADASGQLD